MDTSPERTDFLAGVLVTAIEGGIGYWAETRNYRYAHDGDGNLLTASAEVRDAENGNGDWMPATLGTVQAGINEIKEGNIRLSRRVVGQVLAADRENNAGEIDAESADCVLQAGLLGGIPYG